MSASCRGRWGSGGQVCCGLVAPRGEGAAGSVLKRSSRLIPWSPRVRGWEPRSSPPPAARLRSPPPAASGNAALKKFSEKTKLTVAPLCPSKPTSELNPASLPAYLSSLPFPRRFCPEWEMDLSLRLDVIISLGRVIGQVSACLLV